jgi:glycogen operon protein
VYFNGDGIGEPDERGEKIVDDSFIVCFNAHDGDIDFTLPPSSWGTEWVGELDTTDPTGTTDMTATADSVVTVGARSVLVLRRTS